MFISFQYFVGQYRKIMAWYDHKFFGLYCIVFLRFLA